LEKTQLGTAKAGELEKIGKYTNLATACKAELIPFVVETLGGYSKQSEKLLDNIILSSVEHQSLWSPEEIKQELLGTIAIAIQRGNAMIFDAAHHRTIVEAGRMNNPITEAIVAA